MLMRRRSLIVRSLWACLVALLCAGCSLITTFSECTDDSDCPTGACNDGICGGAIGCEVTEDCSDGQQCIHGQCHLVDEELCTVADAVEPDPDQETLHIGLLLPYTGRNAAKADATGKSAETAFRQINSTHSGVRRVHLGALRCDTEQNSSRATEVADYLVNTLGVQSVIGSISSSETLAVAEITIEAGVVLVSPASTSPTLSTLPDDDLVWRTIASDALQGPALANIVAEGGFTNLLVLALDDAYGQGLFTSFIAAVDDGVNIEAINYSVDDNGDLIAESLVNDATALLANNAYQPDAVIVMGSLESQQLIFALEGTFFESLPAEDRPIWILSEAGRDAGLLDAQYSDAWARIQGTIIQAPDSPIYDDFALRLRTNYMLNADEHPFADKAYDAAWLLALAHGSAADPLDTTGADVADALAVTNRNEPFAPGDDLETALDRLAEGGLDYQGASGPVDFDPATGDVQSEISRWVINTDGATPEFQTLGVVFTPGN